MTLTPSAEKPNPPATASSSPASVSMEQFIQSHGDMIYDLCESVLKDPVHAQAAFQTIARTVDRTPRSERYAEHERAWILHLTCGEILESHRKHVRPAPMAETVEASADQGLTHRLHHFRGFFGRLAPADQLLLLMRDKFSIPWNEIASALGIPEGSARIRRQHSLRTLEEWIWDPS